MILVIDANVLIAAFLKVSTCRKIMLSEDISLCSPDWLKDEFKSNEEVLRKKFKSRVDFSETKDILFKFIRIVNSSEYSAFIPEASKLTRHIGDIPYFAAALKLDCAIWSEEKSFKQQSKVMVYSTSDLIKVLDL